MAQPPQVSRCRGSDVSWWADAVGSIWVYSRTLTTLPGGPCVLVLCHPIKHVSEPEQLLPRGGGAFLAEVDGNLTA